MIITLDGPAGAGKSSAARMLADRLGFEVLDTGAMYRAVALSALRSGLSLNDSHLLERLLDQTNLRVLSGQIRLNDEDVTHLIRTPEVATAASVIGTVPVVRTRLSIWQRQAGEGRDLVCEGRDQGTVVFPDAAFKFFLVADTRERARRRMEQMTKQGEQVDLESLIRAIEERDQRDAKRDLSPMVPAWDAIHLDTTDLTEIQVVDQMERIVKSGRQTQQQ